VTVVPPVAGHDPTGGPAAGAPAGTGIAAAAATGASAVAASAVAAHARSPASPDASAASRPDETGIRTGERTVPVATAPRDPSAAGRPAAAGAEAGRVTGTGVASAGRSSTGRVGRRGIGRGSVIVGLTVLLLAVIVGGVAAYLLLPSATAVVTPREETIGPVSMRISASTSVTETDIEAGVVPAKVVSVDVQAADTFPATGKRVQETRAKGSVQFQNLDPTASNSIAKGAIVRTGDGIRFRTAAAVTVSAAQLVGTTIFPAAAEVNVTAVDAGPEGNVPANAIVEVPRGESGLFLRVTNPSPTSGGAREEFPRVTQEDVDKALQALDGTLQAEFTARLADPSLVDGDVSVFPETAKLGEVTPSVAPDKLVGQEVETFELAATATGTVTTVDAAPVRTIAEARLDASVEPGHQLVAGSSEVTESPAVVEGDRITYPVVATARQIALLDPARLKAEIIGKPLAEARTILEAYGDTVLQVWPDWVGTIPTIESRVEVSVEGPVASGDGTSSEAPSTMPEASP
jgi:Baseplate J-like protein